MAAVPAERISISNERTFERDGSLRLMGVGVSGLGTGGQFALV